MLISVLQTIGQILTAGIAITAFSLLIYALTFNLRDRVARSFMLILACVTITYTGEALGSVTDELVLADYWYRLQWVGLVFLPATYYHFSDALLATTGRPSRGRRRLAVRFGYVISTVFLLALPLGFLVGSLVSDGRGLIYLERTPLTVLFTIFYIGGFIWAWSNFFRAYQRTVTSTSRRRMRYLMLGALAPAFGSFPYLIFGANFASDHQLFFWILAIIATILVFWFLVGMAYAVAFFGIPWPDRVVKRRLAKWLIRGPVTASVALGLTTIVRRAGQSFGINDTVIVPLVMVLTVLIMEHLITIFSPVWESWLFEGDQEDLLLLQNLEERLMTPGDMRQFLESVLAAGLDLCQSRYAFVAEIGPLGVDTLVTVGSIDTMLTSDEQAGLLKITVEQSEQSRIFSWEDYWILPLYSTRPNYDLPMDQLESSGVPSESHPPVIGLMGVAHPSGKRLELEQVQELQALAQRAALVLDDRRVQQDVFSSLRDLTPQVEQIERFRAASRFNRNAMFQDPDTLPVNADVTQQVKDALSHYWGGPKLSSSPLLRLQIVQRALNAHGGNATNALRAILREAIDRVRPEGDRRFTGEWVLYNILEMKFMEGRKVRDVAKKLAVSEADLYRKQRVAIEAVAEVIMEMELDTQQGEGVQSE